MKMYRQGRPPSFRIINLAPSVTQASCVHIACVHSICHVNNIVGVWVICSRCPEKYEFDRLCVEHIKTRVNRLGIVKPGARFSGTHLLAKPFHIHSHYTHTHARRQRQLQYIFQ